ncbi:MAG: hypothetical protein HFJ54_02420 [Clostridia bacterium]|nr:hypothetical protein [Clostridia bacterium]
MSGIAETLNNLGVHITGSDFSESEITSKLISDGIDVTIRFRFRKGQKCRFSSLYCGYLSR